MLYIIFLTGKCNLNCKYCGGSIPRRVMPGEIKYSLNDLKDFISQDSNPSIAFYGGEPLLRINLMKKIMDKIEAKHFIIQTNGLFLKDVEEEYIRRFSSILVSIDGRKDVTDFYRGDGIYDKIIENVEKIKNIFHGELIARMVATEKTDIYLDVKHLLSLDLFTHIHWQLNVIWSPNELWNDFNSWIHKYNLGVSKLVDFWIDEMRKGNVLGIVPFLGVMKALLGYKNSSPPCGAGVNSFTIATDGRILACPVCADFDWNVLGDLKRGIIRHVEISEPCKSCEYSKVCGGRCLFFNRERLWGSEGFNLVCSTVKHLIKEIEKVKDVAVRLCGKEKLVYPKFNNTTEIIP
jgi:putative peptide-modifying radical SAM enzyme